MRVVVVDNDPDALELVVTDLAYEGHDIVGSAMSAGAAEELCLALRPDVVVLDHRMPPGLTGVEAAGRLRAALPELRIIVYSNYDTAEVVAGTRAAGATFITKGNLRALRWAVGR